MIASRWPNACASAIGTGRAEVADVEADEQVGQRPVLRRLDGRAGGWRRRSRRSPRARAPGPSRCVKMSPMSWMQPELEEEARRCARRSPRCPARRGTRSARSRRAIWTGTARSTQRVSLSPSSRTSVLAAGTGRSVGNAHGFERFGPVGQHRADDLGDHVAGLAHDDRVARPHVLGPHLVLVVQRGQADGGAADEHRLEQGERRGLAGAADRHVDVEQLGGALLGRELVGDRPARRPAGEAELAALARGRRPSRPRRRSRSRGRGGAAASARSTRAPRRGSAARVISGFTGRPDDREELERLVVAGEARDRPTTSPSW